MWWGCWERSKDFGVVRSCREWSGDVSGDGGGVWQSGSAQGGCCDQEFVGIG